MRSFIRRLLHDPTGVTVVEYGLIVGLISITLIASFQSFSNQLVNTYLIVNTYTANAQSKN